METKPETEPFPPLERRKHAPAGVESKLRGIGFRVSFRLLANPSGPDPPENPASYQ